MSAPLHNANRTSHNCGKRARKRAGNAFTLIELVVTIAISAIVVSTFALSLHQGAMNLKQQRALRCAMFLSDSSCNQSCG